MRISHWGLPVACAPVLLVAGGCYSYNPYSPYGPGGYGGVYSSPPAGIVQPGTPYAPPGGYGQPGFAPQGQPGIAPQGGFGQPGFQSDAPQFPTQADPPGGATWQQPSNGSPGFSDDGPTYSPNDGIGPSDTPVPLYDEPTRPGFDSQPFEPSNTEPFESSNNEPFESSPNDSTFGEDVTPFGVDYRHSPGRLQTAQQVATAGQGAERFLPPVRSQGVVVTRQLAATTARAQSPEPSPFSHDRRGYRWLRGVVDFDPEERTWNIIYSLNPDPSDRFGGSIALIDGILLEALQDNDRVLIQGRIDMRARDRFGKPKYRVEHVGRIVPAE